jgi:hypothetical protein
MRNGTNNSQPFEINNGIELEAIKNNTTEIGLYRFINFIIPLITICK